MDPKNELRVVIFCLDLKKKLWKFRPQKLKVDLIFIVFVSKQILNLIYRLTFPAVVLKVCLDPLVCTSMTMEWL